MKYTRQREIEKYVLEHEYASLDALCGHFNISKNTVRRDIAQLVENGSVKKVYGGVQAVQTAAPAMINYTDRSSSSLSEKEAIGAMASQYVQNRDVIFLDSGTTTIHVLPHIARLSGVTVLTNNLQALNKCLEYPQLNTIAFGGQLNPESASFSANFCSLDNVFSFNINKAFMAATGISVEKGVTNSSPGELAIKKTVMEISDECILLADESKFGRAALLTYAPLTAFSRVVTNRCPVAEICDFLSDNGIELISR